MIKKLLLTSFLLFSLVGVILPAKRENSKLFDYCYSLEKILSRNSIQARKNVPRNIKSISKDIAKFGISKTNGALIKQVIDQYKSSKNSGIINFFPNQFYCFLGYWIENLKPGTFESIILEQSKKTFNEFKDIKDEVDGFLNDINSEYKNIKDEFNSIF